MWGSSTLHLWAPLHYTAPCTYGPLYITQHPAPMDPFTLHSTLHLWTPLHYTAPCTYGCLYITQHPAPLDAFTLYSILKSLGSYWCPGVCCSVYAVFLHLIPTSISLCNFTVFSESTAKIQYREHLMHFQKMLQKCVI